MEDNPENDAQDVNHASNLYRAIDTLKERIKKLEFELTKKEDAKGDIRDSLYLANERLSFLLDVSRGVYE